jgi:hypothetical protein
MNQKKIQVDINLADLEELTSIPKIGPELARRIIASRPYKDMDDLERVNGIGPILLDQIRPHLTITPSSEQVESQKPEKEARKPLIPAATKEMIESPADSESVVEPDDVIELPAPGEWERVDSHPAAQSEEQVIKKTAAAKAEKDEKPEAKTTSKELLAIPQPVKKKKRFTEGDNQLLYGLAFSLVTLLLAVLLSLAIFGMINGGLRYASNERFADMQRQVETLESKTKYLEEETLSLRTRLDSLEALSGRVKNVENSLTDLDTDLKKQAGRITLVEEDTAAINLQMVEVKRLSQEFNRFLEGLQTLIKDIRPAVSP